MTLEIKYGRVPAPWELYLLVEIENNFGKGTIAPFNLASQRRRIVPVSQ